ncbi:uncharacterized protein LOC126176788 [Schistocerca cancellata]|uniref:uncharacterized protein LOC126176788 n=1 Tax=Schistocerca cancellata TaxID=274614 RepID=UPI00211931D8|nr:uncharacterized protein LOC126176788 [Schistocerca cancellata]
MQINLQSVALHQELSAGVETSNSGSCFSKMTTIGMSPFSRLEVVRQGVPRPERREIIILRKGPKPQSPPLVSMVPVAPAVPVKEEPSDGATPVAPPTSGGRRKRTMASSSRRDGQQPPPLAVARRNARERNRVKQVNNGFANLRQHIPAAITAAYAAASGADLRAGGMNGGGGAARKLSKVETLRMAVDYIRRLQQLLAEADGVEMPTMGPASGAGNNGGADSPPVLIEDDDDESIAGLDASSPEPQHSVEAGFPNTPEGASSSSLLNFVGATSPQRQNEHYFASLTSPSKHPFPPQTTSPTRQQHVSESCIVPSVLSVEELATSSHFKQQDLSSRLPTVERTLLLSPDETAGLSQEKAEAPHGGLAYDVATLVSAGGGATSGLLRPQLPLALSRSHLQQLSAYEAAAASPLCDDALDGGAPASATSTFLRAHQLAASLVAQGYHYTLQVPPAPHPVGLKKEPTDSSDVMDVIGSWWDHEQKMRQQTAT